MAQQNYPLPKDKYIEKKKQEQQDILKTLEEGVKDVFFSDKYADFLKTYSKFHKYSINNSIMIIMQKPDSTNVASFQTWKKLGRSVNKGEKGIKVMVPIPYKYDKEVEKDGKTETVEMTGTSFRVGNVFDISQTTGKELPTLTTTLTENSPDIEKAIDAIARTARVPIHFDADMPFEKKGYYSITDKKIVINDNLSDVQTFKTLIHEISHSKIHATDKDKYNASEREVQGVELALRLTGSGIKNLAQLIYAASTSEKNLNTRSGEVKKVAQAILIKHYIYQYYSHSQSIPLNYIILIKCKS